MLSIFSTVDRLGKENPSERQAGLAQLQELVAGGVDLDERDDMFFRAIDLLAMGYDSQEAAMGIEIMAEAGFAQDMLRGPTDSDMPPMMMAAFRGSHVMVSKFLELGMPADVKGSAPSQNILDGTPFHAVVVGFRSVSKHDYAQCLSHLLSYCPEGLDVPDRLNQRPVDLAVKNAAVTGDRTLADAIVAYGVSLSNGSATDAASFLKVIGRRSGQADAIRSLVAVNQVREFLKDLPSTSHVPRP